VSKPSHREAILNAGLKVMFRSGYQGASVRDICAAADVPQGSFTNHFCSKEAFAEEVLDRYFANSKGFVREALEDKSLTPAATEAVSGHHQRQTGRRQMESRLPDRRFQS
jgi:TetR/AcrR family transcriptional repressor of nem operon